MDFDKRIKVEKEEFLKNPRKGIEDRLAGGRDFIKELSNFTRSQKKPYLLLIFSEFRKEYHSIISELYKRKIISPINFHDETETIKLLMRIREVYSVVKDYQDKIKSRDVSSLALARAYATQLEMIWNKLKKLVQLEELKDGKDYMNLGELNGKISKLEEKYNLNLKNIQSLLNSQLRNSVNHEDVKFEAPDTIVFFNKGKIIKELTAEELVEQLMELLVIHMALESIEKTMVISSLQPLLKLDDAQLNEYCKTGILTKEMKDKITN